MNSVVKSMNSGNMYKYSNIPSNETQLKITQQKSKLIIL